MMFVLTCLLIVYLFLGISILIAYSKIKQVTILDLFFAGVVLWGTPIIIIVSLAKNL